MKIDNLKANFMEVVKVMDRTADLAKQGYDAFWEGVRQLKGVMIVREPATIPVVARRHPGHMPHRR